MPTPTPTGTLTPQAQQGLAYLRTINPTLADSIAKSFAPSTTTPINAGTLGAPSSITVTPPPQTPIPDYTKVQLSTPAPIVNTARQDALDAERSAIVSDIGDLTTKQGTKSARQSELEAAQGIPQLNTQLNEINNLIRGEQSAALAANEKSENRLAPTFAIRGEQAAIERQRAVKVYAWAAAAEAIQGNIALANDYVERTLASEFDPLEKELEHKRFQLAENKEQYSREETRAAGERQRAFDKEKEELAQKREDRSSILQIMLQAAQNGADNITLSKIQSSTSPEAAATAASGFLQTADTQVIDADGRRKLINTRTGATIADLGAVPVTKTGSGGKSGSTSGGVIDPKTPDYLLSVVRNSKGGKALTGDQTTPLTKASIVLNQVAELANTISTTNTGPILGILRDNNPYDVKARLLSAQLRSTVPNLARGIYGEVGVLTDADIQNYIQTLPNVRTPQEANDLVLSMTIKTIMNSMGAQLESLAASGRDVSGYENIYTRMKGLADSLVPASAASTPAAKEDAFKNVLGITTTTPTTKSGGFLGAIGGFFSGLFGK